MDKVYVHAVLKLRIGGASEFYKAMQKQVVILEAHGWRLVGAWTTVVGAISTVIDIWELPDANSFFDVKKEWTKTKEYEEFKEVVSKHLIEEQISFVSQTPYSP